MNRRHRRIMEETAERKLDEFDQEMINELIQQFTDELDGLELSEIDEDLILGIYQNWHGSLPDPGEWAAAEAESEYESYLDAKYDEMRDDALLGG